MKALIHILMIRTKLCSLHIRQCHFLSPDLMFRLQISPVFTARLTDPCLPSQGHSHQLFHVSAVVGTHFQMEGVIADMTSRRTWLLAHGVVPSFTGTIGALALSLVLNLGVIGIFSAPLLWKPCRGWKQPHACERKER